MLLDIKSRSRSAFIRAASGRENEAFRVTKPSAADYFPDDTFTTLQQARFLMSGSSLDRASQKRRS